MPLAVPVWATNFAPGQFDTAATMNTIGNGGTFLTNPPVADLYQNTVQSVPNATNAAVLFDSTTQDTYGGHSNVTNTSRYTAQVAGTYWVSGIAVFAINGTGFRAASLAKNGVNNTVTGCFATAATQTGYYTTALICGFVQLAAGDYVELVTYQTSGGALNTAVGSGQCSSMKVWWAHA